MSAMDRVREALALGEEKNAKKLNIGQPGDLQGRKVIPFSFYVQVGFAVVGGITAIALTVTAIALAKFLLLAAAAIAVLLCLSNAISAFSTYNQAPGAELDTILDKLSAKIHKLFNINKGLQKNKVALEQDVIRNKGDGVLEVKNEPVKEFEKDDEIADENLKEMAQLNEQANEQMNLMIKFKNEIVEFSKKHKEENLVLRQQLDKFLQFFEKTEEIPLSLKDGNYDIEEIELEDFDNPQEFLNKLLEDSRVLYNQFALILPKLEEHIVEDEAYKNVENDFKIKIENLEARLKQKENELALISNQINSKLTDSVLAFK